MKVDGGGGKNVFFIVGINWNSLTKKQRSSNSLRNMGVGVGGISLKTAKRMKIFNPREGNGRGDLSLSCIS